MNARILCVDDEPNVLAAFQRSLRRHFIVDVAASGDEALRLMDAGHGYCVIVADMQMPDMNGAQLLATTAERHPDVVRVMITGNADQRTAVEAVNSGRIFRFLNKPCPAEALAEAIREAIKQHRLIVAERELLEGTLHGAINALNEVLSMVDPVSFGLGKALQEKMRRFIKTLNRPSHWEYEVAALLSQIGHVAIPQSVVKRARAGHGLTDSEKAMLVRVPQTGADLLAPIPRLEGVALAIRYQRKHFDGSGLPEDDVAGEGIPLAARILKILIDLHDIQDRGVVPVGQEFVALDKRQGHYDPRVLKALALCFDARPPGRDRKTVETRPVMACDLHPNQVLGTDVRTIDGTLLVPAGQTLTPILVEKIRNFATLMGVREPIGIELEC
jgi:response regulator RpfG family c-di-GMP phosphodiesterase